MFDETNERSKLLDEMVEFIEMKRAEGLKEGLTEKPELPTPVPHSEEEEPLLPDEPDMPAEEPDEEEDKLKLLKLKKSIGR